MTQPSHADLQSDIATLLERVEANGKQAHDGFAAVNTRLAAIEARVMAYDILKARLIGMATVSAATLAAAWYWFADKIEAALGK